MLSGCHASCHQGGHTGGASQGDQAGDAQLTKTEGQQEIAGHWGSFSLIIGSCCTYQSLEKEIRGIVREDLFNILSPWVTLKSLIP